MDRPEDALGRVLVGDALIRARPGRELTGRALSALLVSAALMSAAVVTLGAPLVPDVQRRFGVSAEDAQWSYTITLLVGAAFTPLLGRLADGRRRRDATLGVCAAVTAGCALSALAPTLPVFLAGRALQGIAVALVAMTIACARDLVLGPGGVRLVALLSITTALGAGAAYPVTTFTADHLGVGAAFGGAAALAAVVTVAVARGLPAGVAAGRPSSLDVKGAVLLVVATSSGLLGVSQGNRWGWASAPVLGLLVGSALLLAGWVLLELRTVAPLVELRLLGRRNVLAAHLVGMLMGVGLYNTPVLVTWVGVAPASLPYGVGLSLSGLGLVMLPIAACNYVSSRAATRASRRWGRRLPLAAGGLSGAVGPMVLLTVDGRLALLVAAVVFTALGAGATFGTMPALIVDSVEPGETGSATSMNILLRAVGGAVGSAATAAVIGAAAPVDGFPSTTGLAVAAVVCAATSLVAATISVVLPARRGPVGASALLEPVPLPRVDRQQR